MVAQYSKGFHPFESLKNKLLFNREFEGESLKEVYTMKNRYVIIKHNQEAYKKASKKIKTAIINELSKILNMNKQDGGDMIQRRN
jgi:hypothetical protein